MKLTSEYINEGSSHFESVKNLWRENSRTLGFFPKGAFKDYAADKCILVAEYNNEFAGYLLFRKVKGHSIYPHAAIVHLCTSNKFRKKGVSRFLVEKLSSDISDTFQKLKISCRNDYNINEFWVKLGFVYKSEETGRSGKQLFKWERNFKEIPLPLLELIRQLEKPKKFRVVIDANVCFRIQDPLPEKGHNQDLSLEAKALEEDWIKEEISIVITDELPNEIQKNEDKNKRHQRINFINRFDKITTDFGVVETKLKELIKIFGHPSNDNKRSDLYQLAHTAAGDCYYFITQDLPLLNKAEEVDNKLGVTVLTPGELVSHIDELNRTNEYHPRRLAGSNRLHTSRLSANQVNDLYTAFRKSSTSERKPVLLNKIRKFLSAPSSYEQILYHQSNGNQLAFITYDTRVPNLLKIPILRLAKSNIATTVIRYVIRNAVIKAIFEKRQVIIVSDMEGQYLLFEQAFIDNDFIKSKGKWVKINIFGSLSTEKLIQELNNITEKVKDNSDVISKLIKGIYSASNNHDIMSYVELEKKLYPLKITDSKIPTFVIPIKPIWAQNLFDETLAEQNLWGANDNLLMRLENVFYRSKKTFGKIVFPARILWYVSQQKHKNGSKMIRACSYINEVKVGNASHLFKKYQRFGVYQWKDIKELTEGNTTQDIMAIIFCNSELLPNPLPFANYRDILRETENKSAVVQSPQKITEDTFFKIYSNCTTGYHE